MAQELLEGRKYAPAHLGRVLVVGLGKSGQAAVEYCSALLGSRVDSLSVSAGDENANARAFIDKFAGQDIVFRFNWEAFDEQFDLCIMSPGVADTSALYQHARAASADLVGELEFAWRESAADALWVAITGTNGKTTTTSLTTHILKAAGLRAEAVGNIGEVALGCVAAPDAPEVYCAEVSSFQLASISRFAPDAVALLNITPDHISWHGSMERYIQAKARMLDTTLVPGASRAPVAVVDCVNEVSRGLFEHFHAEHPDVKTIRLLERKPEDCLADSMCGAAYVADSRLVVDAGQPVALCTVEDLQIKGSHNVSNALAAASLCLALGIAPETVRRALVSFAPLPHRIEPCGQAHGVRFFNDSKATNVDATLKAFTAFAPGEVICLLGGHDKGTALDDLVGAAHQTCKAVVCYGESRPRFLAAFGAAGLADGSGTEVDGLRVFAAENLAPAVRVAWNAAAPGDAILLSPACSSFDEFSGFVERGNTFKRLVAREFCDAC